MVDILFNNNIEIGMIVTTKKEIEIQLKVCHVVIFVVWSASESFLLKLFNMRK